MSPGRASRSVARKACGSSSPLGSRTSSQRIGTGGPPPRYHSAGPPAVSTRRLGPARPGRHAAAIPQRGAAGDLDEAIGSAVPEADAVALPSEVAILEEGSELFQTLALDRGAATAFALVRRGGGGR